MIEPAEFRNFEHAGWEEIPTQYHCAFGELTSQAIEPLLDAARVRKGTKLLDLACGRVTFPRRLRNVERLCWVSISLLR